MMMSHLDKMNHQILSNQKPESAVMGVTHFSAVTSVHVHQLHLRDGGLIAAGRSSSRSRYSISAGLGFSLKCDISPALAVTWMCDNIGLSPVKVLEQHGSFWVDVLNTEYPAVQFFPHGPHGTLSAPSVLFPLFPVTSWTVTHLLLFCWPKPLLGRVMVSMWAVNREPEFEALQN